MDALGGVRQVTQDDVAGRQVGVLVEEVVLRRPHILETGLVGGLDHFDVVHDRNVLGVGDRLTKRLVDGGLEEDAELQWGLLCRGLVDRSAAFAVAAVLGPNRYRVVMLAQSEPKRRAWAP